jgi:hypothetical protein
LAEVKSRRTKLFGPDSFAVAIFLDSRFHEENFKEFIKEMKTSAD